MLVELQGSYESWQELFSHMVDDYLLQRSLASLDATTLMDLFNLCHTFEIHELQKIYLKRLEYALSRESVGQAS
jgi:hypothetical protein